MEIIRHFGLIASRSNQCLDVLDSWIHFVWRLCYCAVCSVLYALCCLLYARALRVLLWLKVAMFCAGEEYDGEREDTGDEKEKSHLS